MAVKKISEKYILVAGIAPVAVLEKYRGFIKTYQKEKEVKVRLILIHDQDLKSESLEKIKDFFDEIVEVDFNNDDNLNKNLLPYVGKVLAVVSRGDYNIWRLAALVPHVPYVKMPNAESLFWSTDKLKMRRRFRAYDRKITPKYRLVTSDSDSEIEKIEKTLGYPLIVKPLGFAQSLLVTNVYHREELKKVLKKIFKEISKIYAEKVYSEKPGVKSGAVLVEEIMEGEQYSIDTYINSKGKIYFCPIVHVKTGKRIGFDDYFGYRQMTPTRLKKTSIEAAQEVCAKAIHALGLRSITAHVELMRTEDGWKVIEVGPRVGGFREDIYQYSYGINHAVNDLKIRMGIKPEIPKKIKGYSAALKIYARKEGIIKSVKGIKKIEKLDSYIKNLSTPKRAGDRAKFAKNGGKSVVNVFLFNKSRSNLLADIRRLEKTIDIKVK